MAYTPPSEVDIMSNMLNTYSALVPTADDLNRGSVIRSMFETVAREFKNQTTDETEYAAELQETAAYSMFNFPLLQPQSAYTMEQFSVTSAPTGNVTVPAGTTVEKNGTTVQYQTVGDFTWSSGLTSVSIRVACTEAGTVGNASAGTITTLVGSIPGLSNVTVTNVKDVISGTDLETELQRAQRYQKFIKTIHRGDIDALKEGVKDAQIIDNYGYISEQVVKSNVIEGIGSNAIYVDNGTYDTSSALITQAQQVINGYIDVNGNYIIGYKAAGIPSTVYISTLQGVTITASVTLEPGYTLDMVQQTIIDAITKLVQNLDVGDTLYLASVRLAIGNVAGVLNHTISSPTTDIVPCLIVPSAKPTLATATTGGSLAAGTYYVNYTWTNANGETVTGGVNTEQSIATTGSTSTITVTLPAFPVGVTGANIYISTASGTETKQGTTTTTSYTQTATLVGGQAMPTSNTATFGGTLIHLSATPSISST